MMEEYIGYQPCDVCKAYRCDGCLLSELESIPSCQTGECAFCGDAGCALGMDQKCKASSCYEGDE